MESHRQGMNFLIRLTVLMLVMAAWNLPACRVQREQDFVASVKAYNTALLWGEYHRAKAFVAPDHADEFLARMLRLEEDRLQIVDYEILDHAVDAKEDTGKSVVRMEYYWVTQGKTRKVLSTQNWILVDKRWKVIPDLDLFQH